MTTLYFAGAENASHRSLLEECGVTRFAFNLSRLAKQVKRLDLWDVADHLPEGSEWIAYADRDTQWSACEPIMAQNPTLLIGPQTWEDDLGDFSGFAPWWYEGMESISPYLAIRDDYVKHQDTLRRLLSDYGRERTLLAVTGSTRSIERLDVVISNAWWSSMKFGETQIWSGGRMHRYSADQKMAARQRHRMDIERLGIDYGLVMADDAEATARLAIESWKCWGDRHGAQMSSNGASYLPVLPDSLIPPLAIGGGSNGHQPVPGRNQVIPVLGIEPIISKSTDGSGVETIEETPAIRLAGESQRKCDTCQLAHNCPAFQPQASCAYNIPIELRTRDQLQATMRAMAEMQSQRIVFARFSEELDGQGINEDLSKEMDRFFRMLQAMRDISDTRDIFRLEVEAKGHAGMLSRLFGSSVGSAARNLSAPIDADEVVVAFEDH